MNLSKGGNEYLKITETDRCVFCGIMDETLVKHHIRVKGCGIAKKMSDAVVIPVCVYHHRCCDARTISTQNQLNRWMKYMLERLTQEIGQTNAVDKIGEAYLEMLNE